MTSINAFQTEQERFWAGKFGNEYIERNRSKVSDNIHFFSKILSKTSNVKSIIEFGSNIGSNLIAIHHLLPDIRLSAVEINKKAVKELKKIDYISEIFPVSILEFQPPKKYDLCFVKGVLIHINPENLKDIYNLLYHSCSKYILIAEYYNPSPVEIIYRGHKGKLFKRDFAGEIMDLFPDLWLIDYGFCYHRDPNFSQDDITWFLLKKNSAL
jgi:spore coat polysaccharide biosynthesis protein SpsF